MLPGPVKLLVLGSLLGFGLGLDFKGLVFVLDIYGEHRRSCGHLK